MGEIDSRSEKAFPNGSSEQEGLSIRTKVFLILLGFGLVPLLLVSFLTIRTVEQRTIEQQFEALHAVAQVQDGRVELLLQERLGDFSVLTSALQITAVAELIGQCGSNPYSEQMNALLVRIRDQILSKFTDLTLVDLDGCVQASTAPGRVGVRLGNGLLFSEDTGSLVRSLSDEDSPSQPLILGKLQHNASGDLVHPMTGAIIDDGVSTGFMVAEANASLLTVWAADYTGLGETGETLFAFLDEESNRVVAAVPFRFAPDVALVGGGPMSNLSSPGVQAILGNESEFEVASDYRDMEALAVTRQVTPTGWGVIVKIDRSEALSTVSDLTRFLAAANIAVFATILVAAATIARRRTDPIRRMTETAVGIASGDLDQRVTVDARDELGVLANAVNEMADELVDRHRMLEDEVRARTAQLRRTIDTLEASNRDLERMAVVSAHDLSEPLRKIRVFGERLEDTAGDALDEKSRDYLKRVTSAAGRMQGLIDGLLTYSRVTTRSETFEWVDLDEVAHDVVADFEVLIDDTGATVEIGDLPRVVGEPTQMRQLIQNLLSNSLKYHEQDDEPWVRISAKVTDEHVRDLPGPICQLIVEDHGIGIPDEHLVSVFDLFTRLQDQVEYPGSGLGLSVCRRILEHHGGTIVIEPNELKGIRVIASIPVTPQPWE